MTPRSELSPQRVERFALAAIDRWNRQAVDDGQLQFGHPLANLQSEECTVIVERNNVDAGQPLEHGPIHDDERPPAGDLRQFGVRFRLHCHRVYRPFFE